MLAFLWAISVFVAAALGFLVAALLGAGKLDDALKDERGHWTLAMDNAHRHAREQLSESGDRHMKSLEVLLQAQREMMLEQRREYEIQVVGLQASLAISNDELRKALQRSVNQALPVHDGSEEVSVDEADRRAAVAAEQRMIGAE